MVTRSSWKTPLLPLDALVQGTNLLLALGVVLSANRITHAGAWLATHCMLAASVVLIARFDTRSARPTDRLTFVHYWLPVGFVLMIYFELGLLIPLLRDYTDHRYDHALQALDVRLLGDPLAFVTRWASRPLSDLLTFCYFAYYPLVIAVPLAVYVRGTREDFERASAVIFVAFVLSYAGYLLWPAVGPHRVFENERPDVLAGFGLARAGYGFLRHVPNEPPDAFPSGHVLLAVLVPALARRFRPALFPWLAPIGAGIVVATVYLRLHYLADVAAAFVLAPVAWTLGLAVCRWFARRSLALELFEPEADGSSRRVCARCETTRRRCRTSSRTTRWSTSRTTNTCSSRG
jgi:membrane-associated phospholipid phosphatase